MRGDNAPLDKFVEICEKYNDKFDEEIRIQISADHTEYDIDYAIGVLKKFKAKQ